MTGAGSSDYNGLYCPVGRYNDKYLYEKDSSHIVYWSEWYGYGYWFMGPNYNPSNSYYLYDGSDMTPPVNTWWYEYNGMWPDPYVMSVSCAPNTSSSSSSRSSDSSSSFSSRSSRSSTSSSTSISDESSSSSSTSSTSSLSSSSLSPGNVYVDSSSSLMKDSSSYLLDWSTSSSSQWKIGSSQSSSSSESSSNSSSSNSSSSSSKSSTSSSHSGGFPVYPDVCYYFYTAAFNLNSLQWQVDPIGWQCGATPPVVADYWMYVGTSGLECYFEYYADVAGGLCSIDEDCFNKPVPAPKPEVPHDSMLDTTCRTNMKLEILATTPSCPGCFCCWGDNPSWYCQPGYEVGVSGQTPYSENPYVIFNPNDLQTHSHSGTFTNSDDPPRTINYTLYTSPRPGAPTQWTWTLVTQWWNPYGGMYGEGGWESSSYYPLSWYYNISSSYMKAVQYGNMGGGYGINCGMSLKVQRWPAKT